METVFLFDSVPPLGGRVPRLDPDLGPRTEDWKDDGTLVHLAPGSAPVDGDPLSGGRSLVWEGVTNSADEGTGAGRKPRVGPGPGRIGKGISGGVGYLLPKPEAKRGSTHPPSTDFAPPTSHLRLSSTPTVWRRRGLEKDPPPAREDGVGT